jgi:hypothetical protein
MEIKNIVAGHAELWVDGSNVGFLSSGVAQSFEREYFDIMVEQVKGPIKCELISEVMNISTELTEVSMNQLKIAWDQEGSTLLGGTFLAIGTESGANEHTLTIVAKAPAASNFSYMNFHIFKAVSFEAVESTFQRAENTRIPISFKCLKDVLNDNKFGYVSYSNTKGQ